MAITSQDIAVAAEAINRHPNLSPVARRIGLELLNRLNRDNKRPGYGCAWPSKDRLAAALGVGVRSIWRGIDQLTRTGLIHRRRRGRRTTVYTFNWRTLKATATRIKTRLKTLAAQFRRGSTNAKQAIAAKQQNPVKRPFRAESLPQIKNIVLEGARKAIQRTSLPSMSDPALLNKRAHSRLYERLSAFPAATYAHLLNVITPEIEEQAVKAERYEPGTGLSTLNALLAQRGIA